MKNLLGRVWRALRWLGCGFFRLLDASRRLALNLLLLLLVIGAVVLAVVAFSGGIEKHTVLVLAPDGPMVEERPKAPSALVTRQLRGEDSSGVLLRDWVKALDAAAHDDRIDYVLLHLDRFEGAGLATLREAAAAIVAFRASGKPVIAWGSSFDQRQYYLAAHASKVYLHPMGYVLVRGIGQQRNYYKDALDRLGINVHLLRVGKYKSAGEPFVASRPSKEALEADAHLYDALWQLYTQAVETARQVPEGSINRQIDALPDALADVGGDAARLALEANWVDGLKTFDEIRQLLMAEVGKDDKGTSFRRVDLATYVDDVDRSVRGDHVAIVVAQGEISDRDAPAGRIGGLSTAKLIRKVSEDKAARAIVLRVNSPGGSAFGSELIRRQLELARAAGKPVVVSMSDVAASGGYWISLAADRVIAEPSTITGSIGVFGLLPSAEGLMGKLSINTGGYQTTWLAGMPDFRRPLDPRFEALMQSSIEHVYDDFIGKVAAARKLDAGAVEAVAQGRVWTGQQALEHKLVDQVGSLGDAIKAASDLAQRGPGGEPAAEGKLLPIRYASQQPSWRDALMDLLAGRIAGRVESAIAAERDLALAAAAGPLPRELVSELVWLKSLLEGRTPFEAAAHCLCQVTL